MEGSCQCEQGFIRSGNSKNCLKEAEKLGAECKEDVQCSNLGNVTCQNEVCTEKPIEQTIKTGKESRLMETAKSFPTNTSVLCFSGGQQ